MVAIEFIDYLKKMHVSEFLGVEDFSDKMSFMYSVIILLLCTTVIAVKQYFLASIACYIPTLPAGSDFDKFLENYCWVHGTIPFLPGEPIPQTQEEWKLADQTLRINYYQWVPFMLGIQCILFYCPRIVWQTFCYNRTGTDLEHLISVASKASNANSVDRKDLVKHVASTIDAMLFEHREYRIGKIAKFKHRMFEICGIFYASKRMGTWLTFTYLVIKLVYLANAIGQMYVMQVFLGSRSEMLDFGFILVNHMIRGYDWNQTRIFPRVSFCYLDNVRHLGVTNKYIAQCALPVNMLNEKIYIFLWFWTAIVAVFTTASIPLWILRLSLKESRRNFIRKFLRLQEIYSKEDEKMLHQFIANFLHHDGIFLLRMISMNAGDVVTSDIVVELWNMYRLECKNDKILTLIDKNGVQPKTNDADDEITRKRVTSEDKEEFNTKIKASIV